MATGVLCAMMTGNCKMRKWSVVNWAMAELWLQLARLLMEGEVVQFGMTMCAAVAVKPASLSVTIMVLECMTVATVRMQECSVQVSDAASSVRCVVCGGRQQSEG